MTQHPTNCNLCKAIDFKNKPNLEWHQKNMYCKAFYERMSRPSTFTWNFEIDVLKYIIGLEQSFIKSDPLQVASCHEDVELFDSIFVLLHQIPSCRNGIELLKCDINHLTLKVLFHKSFNLNEGKINSTTNCEK
jgi:hypothetical protein